MLAAWKFWHAPSDQVRLIRRLQGHRCASTGKRLPLFRVWRDHRDAPWPDLLRFWGLPNLQAINREAHAVKSSGEARQRRAAGKPMGAVGPASRLTAARMIFHLTQPLD
jgi:hypothetical protein